MRRGAGFVRGHASACLASAARRARTRSNGAGAGTELGDGGGGKRRRFQRPSANPAESAAANMSMLREVMAKTLFRARPEPISRMVFQARMWKKR